MASIVKRKKKYSVVYTYVDESGKKRQKWETFDTSTEAKKRKNQIEYEQETGSFIVPTAKTVNDLLEEYMSIYGVNTWAMSTYESRQSLLSNYVRPIIGDMKLEDLNPRVMDKYYRDLLTVKAVSTRFVKARTEFVTAKTVRQIHKVLHNAFNQAVKWELISRNPVEHATLPKTETKPREIWTADTLIKALEVCDDEILSLAMLRDWKKHFILADKLNQKKWLKNRLSKNLKVIRNFSCRSFKSPVWLNCLRRLLSRCKLKRQILSFERVCFFSTYLEFGNTNYADFVLQYI